jgi:hypothetical protein
MARVPSCRSWNRAGFWRAGLSIRERYGDAIFRDVLVDTLEIEQRLDHFHACKRSLTNAACRTDVLHGTLSMLFALNTERQKDESRVVATPGAFRLTVSNLAHFESLVTCFLLLFCNLKLCQWVLCYGGVHFTQQVKAGRAESKEGVL